VPANKTAYDFFLRGNQLSVDPKQWAVARELYERSLAEDARFAPAWARLGRLYHLETKYIESTNGPRAAGDGFVRAEAAFKKALELNPDLPIAHKLFAQLEADMGRAQDATVRLVSRARTADPEIAAGLVTACRYCGLLEASVAAHRRARALDSKIPTSVGHTWFMLADWVSLAKLSVADYPYIVPLALMELGRGEDAMSALRDVEQKIHTRRRHVVTAAIALLEGRAADSVVAMQAMLSPGFRDPEGRFYVARHVARHGDADEALAQLEGIVADGFFCYPVLARDPWFDALRPRSAFETLLARCEERHRAAEAAFARVEGPTLLA
jgi:tetratricopeptide (TPR) repeat protein